MEMSLAPAVLSLVRMAFAVRSSGRRRILNSVDSRAVFDWVDTADDLDVGFHAAMEADGVRHRKLSPPSR